MILAEMSLDYSNREYRWRMVKLSRNKRFMADVKLFNIVVVGSSEQFSGPMIQSKPSITIRKPSIKLTIRRCDQLHFIDWNTVESVIEVNVVMDEDKDFWPALKAICRESLVSDHKLLYRLKGKKRVFCWLYGSSIISMQKDEYTNISTYFVLARRHSFGQEEELAADRNIVLLF